MRWLCAHIAPRSAFGTAIRGDTLFGQLCWAIRHRAGEPALTALLQGYTEGAPFLVVSDAFPHGHVPRPELPPVADIKPTERKKDKKKRWLPLAALREPLARAEYVECAVWTDGAQAHNSISRLTGTTGAGADPFQMSRLWPAKELTLDIHLVLDEARLDADLLETCLTDIGSFGFGRDASIGLGRFEVLGLKEGRPTHTPRPDAFLTLAPCAPQGGDWHASRCYYRPFTRFGRHGAEAATSGQEFKTPLLLADTAAILTPQQVQDSSLFVGRGLGGNGELSRAIGQTVHQGYAPVIPVQLAKEVA